MNNVVRRASEADIRSMLELLAGLFAIEDDFIPDTMLQENGLRMLIDDKDRAVVYVAVSGNKITGMVTGQLVVSTASGGYSLLLEDMYVVPGMRRCGTGTALLNALTAWAKEKGALRMQLVADMRNSGAAYFYGTNGFIKGNMAGMYRCLL